jgi:hypothetical protein
MNKRPYQLQCCAVPSTFAGQALHLVYHHHAGAAAMLLQLVVPYYI